MTRNEWLLYEYHCEDYIYVEEDESEEQE